MATNERSPNHPHGPPSLKMLDAEGRCLWCGDRIKIADLRRRLQQAREAINRTLDDLERGYWPGIAATGYLFRAVGRRPKKLPPETRGLVSEADLKQAQEERDRAVNELVAEVGKGYEWDEKYDAAIERRDEWRDRLAASNARESNLNGELRRVTERGVEAINNLYVNWWGQWSCSRVYQEQRDCERRRAEAAEALAIRVVERAGGALEIAANDLEALDADEHEGWMPSKGELAPWEQARRAINGLYAMLTPAEAQKEGDDAQ